MKTVTLTAGSVTYAIKLRKLLGRAGIESRLVKINNKNGGCIHGVTINDSSFFAAVAIMKENGIDYSVYSNGKI